MAGNFSFDSVGFLMSQIEILISMSHSNMAIEGKHGATLMRASSLNQQGLQQSAESVEFIAKQTPFLLGWLKSSHIDDAVLRLGYWASGDEKKWSELNTRSRALRDNIRTELKDYLFYQYPKAKGQSLLSWRDDWNQVRTAFPAAEVEIFCAVDCYALGHDTASIFHCMRVAEYGLRALAAERRVKLPKAKPIEWATWQEIIRALEGQIKLVGAKKAGPAKDAALEFYSGARADLNGFKDEYRNAVMHVRATYDEFQAIRALTNVKHFMERLAAKIDLRQRQRQRPDITQGG